MVRRGSRLDRGHARHAGRRQGALEEPPSAPNDPVLFIEHKLLYGEKGQTPTDPQFVLPLGKAHVVRPGSDVTVVSYSRQLGTALAAAGSLAAEGVECEVIDLRTISPLDMDTILASLEKTGRLVTVEEGHKSFGVGAEISARVMEQGFDFLEGPVRRCGDFGYADSVFARLGKGGPAQPREGNRSREGNAVGSCQLSVGSCNGQRTTDNGQTDNQKTPPHRHAVAECHDGRRHDRFLASQGRGAD